MQQTDSRSSSSSSAAATPNNHIDSSQNAGDASRTAQARLALEGEINDILQVLFELSVVVYDFQPDGNQLVRNKINTIIDHYRKIDELRKDIDIFIPEEVINFVEHGKNPDLFTQGFVERAASENQFTHGKIQAVDEFRSILSDEFARSFPDLYETGNECNL